MKTLKIIKIGGNIIDDQKALSIFLKQFAELKGPKLLVHGGGKLATQLAHKLDIPVHINQGRRITDHETLDIAIMVYAGKINKTIVAALQSNGCNAIGFTGADGNTIVAEKRTTHPLDYGFVGDIKKVKTTTLNLLLEHQITPVYCAITHNNEGQLLNTNADTIASELAIGLTKHFKIELYFCFEKEGVLRDMTDDTSVIKHINTATYQTLIEDELISDGMLPKLKNCFHAITNGVPKVCMGSTKMLFEANVPYTTIQK